jgi:hypothetical protein
MYEYVDFIVSVQIEEIHRNSGSPDITYTYYNTYIFTTLCKYNAKLTNIKNKVYLHTYAAFLYLKNMREWTVVCYKPLSLTVWPEYFYYANRGSCWKKCLHMYVPNITLYTYVCTYVCMYVLMITLIYFIRDRCYDFRNIFAEKNCEKLAFLRILRKTTIFSPKIGKNR